MKNLLYISPLFTYEGITKTARDYINALLPKMDKIMCSDYNYSKEFGLDKEKIYNAIDVKGKDYITIFNTRPEQWNMISYKYLFGFHVLEGNKWPKQQIKGINKSKIKCLIVPSKRCKDVAITSGVTKDVKIIPYILNKKFKPNRKKFNPKELIFYSSGAIFGLSKKDRKGIDLIFKAWKKYENDPTKLLLLKINTFYAHNMYKNMGEVFYLDAYLRNLYGGEIPTNIQLIDKNLTDEKLIDIYNSVDCVLYPSRGEGFGLIPFEAMACGTPCIVTGGIGCDQYLDTVKKGFLKIENNGLCPAEKRYPYYDGKNLSDWIEPNFKDFQNKIDEFINNSERYIKEALEASEILHKEFNAEKISNDLIEIFNFYDNKVKQ